MIAKYNIFESAGLFRASDWKNNDIDKVKSIIKNSKKIKILI
jgi:hypothetical protein